MVFRNHRNSSSLVTPSCQFIPHNFPTASHSSSSTPPISHGTRICKLSGSTFKYIFPRSILFASYWMWPLNNSVLIKVSCRILFILNYVINSVCDAIPTLRYASRPHKRTGLSIFNLPPLPISTEFSRPFHSASQRRQAMTKFNRQPILSSMSKAFSQSWSWGCGGAVRKK